MSLPQSKTKMSQYCINADELAEYLAVDDGVEWFNEKYPNAKCIRCSKKVDGHTVVYCGDVCETWYCADCRKDGNEDCPCCFPKPKTVVKGRVTIKIATKIKPTKRIIPKSTKHTSGKWVVHQFSPTETYEFLICDLCGGMRGACVQGYCRCVV